MLYLHKLNKYDFSFNRSFDEGQEAASMSFHNIVTTSTSTSKLTTSDKSEHGNSTENGDFPNEIITKCMLVTFKLLEEILTLIFP